MKQKDDSQVRKVYAQIYGAAQYTLGRRRQNVPKSRTLTDEEKSKRVAKMARRAERNRKQLEAEQRRNG